MARFSCTLSVDIPEGARRFDVACYILEAICSWKGQLRPPGGFSDDDPGDPLFGLDASSLLLSFVDEKQRYRICNED